MSHDAKQAAQFRERIIAEQLDKVPRELLALLDTAESLAERLLSSQNRILREQNKQAAMDSPQRKPKRKGARGFNRHESDEVRGSKRKSQTAKISAMDDEPSVDSAMMDPRSHSDRLSHIR